MEFNPVASLGRDTCGYSERIPLTDLLTSVLVFLIAPVSDVGAFFTNLSLEPTWRWYFAMTPFETVFLYLVIGQFSLLNALGIMPLNLSNLINGMPSGRRKRDISNAIGARKDLGVKILNLLRRLDPNECTLRLICEMQNNHLLKPNWSLSDETKLVLASLKNSGETRRKRSSSFLDNNSDRIYIDHPNIQDFEDAVKIGYDSFYSGNSTLCQEKYHSCHSSSEEIFDFVKIIGSHNYSL